METLSFAFGVLSVIAVVLVAVVAVGIVKVFKMQNNIDNLHRIVDNSENHIHQRISNEYTNLDRIINDDRREMLSLHKESIDETIKVFEQVDKRLNELNSYVDSRFDKMENKFTMGHKTSKQIINN